MSLIRVIVIEPERLIRSALSIVIDEAADLTVLDSGSLSDLTESGDWVNVAIVSVSEPAMEALQRTVDVGQASHRTHVLALIGEEFESLAPLAIRAGALGCVSRGSETDDLLSAVKRVSAGDHYFCPRVSLELAREIRSRKPERMTAQSPSATELTSREMSVVAHLAKGMSNIEIAKALHLSEATIKAHLGKVMLKWGARDRIQVLLHAIRGGLVRVD